MSNETTQTAVSLQTFEMKAGELISLAVALTEERIAAQIINTPSATPTTIKTPSPACKAQVSAVLAVKHVLETFIAIVKLEE